MDYAQLNHWTLSLNFKNYWIALNMDWFSVAILYPTLVCVEQIYFPQETYWHEHLAHDNSRN